jgi:hypothetical protein
MGIRLGRLCAIIVVACALAPSQAQAAANNDRCYVCHLNMKSEEVVTVHLKADIGCEQCHGQSDPHRADEDTFTPPEKIFAKAQVNPFCGSAECHPKHSSTTVTAADMKDKVCTDCHGSHKLKVRTRMWDKETRKLILEK